MHNLLILDGAMGTMLQAAGMKAGEHPEVFGFDNPEIVKNIHLKYIEAGSNIIYANTFGANAHKLEGCKIDVDTAIKTAIQSAKEAVVESKRDVKVALDIGPIGELLEPLGVLRFEDAYEIYKEMVVAGEKYGADIIVYETFTDLYDVRAGVLAAKENTKLPVWVTMTYETTGRTFTGTKIESMAVTLEGLGVDAIGFNCSLGPKEILPLAAKLKEWTTLPIIIKPNAGLPNPSTGEYDLHAADFAKLMAEYKSLGISYAGGCCGTAPDFIKELKSELDAAEVKEGKSVKVKTGICSANEMVELNGVRVVGERLNPTGKKRFQEALLNHEMEYICKVAIEEEESGADILDINVGVPGGDEVALMREAVKAVQSVVNIPLQIDSSNPEAIEAGLRVYNGRAIVNSVNAEDDRLDLILPIVKKYGAAVIGLALNENGLPTTAKQRVDNASYILERCLEYGLKKEDVIIDCLTLTVSAQQDQARETLEAVRMVTNDLGLHTTLGVSNISFGLPARSHITENFLIQAMYAGLDLPIVNPNIEGIMNAIYSYKVLSGEDKDSVKYIERFATVKTETKVVTVSNNGEVTKEMVEDAILKGLKEETYNNAKKLLEDHGELEIINEYLIPALDTVGDLYEKQVIFLPQLINAANAASSAFELIKERIANKGEHNVSKGKIVVCTVKGDIHDIGKNIVKVILENYGYRMIDLGRDVDIKNVVDTVVRENVKLVGLSALMTTTLPAMKKTIEEIRKVSDDCKVWVGGAVLTKEYADEMGADFYAPDARSSVDIAKTVLG